MDKIHNAIIEYLRKKKLLTLITDYDYNIKLYPSASVLPALPHALIDTSAMVTINDYLDEHKNIKKKLRRFAKKGGEFRLMERFASEEYVQGIKKCFLSTAEKSIFYLPYQKLYLNAALTTSQRSIDQVYYFFAFMNGKFLGYQAAIKSGKFLNALHGAFDRTQSTTHHAYDILFVKMTEFAIENNLKVIDFGAVLNITKQRMVNQTIPMSYYLYSKYRLVQKFFNYFLKMTSIQGKHQMNFRE